MNKASYNILRVGVGVTHFWIAILIIKNPLGWGLLMQTWALNLLPLPVSLFMYAVAALDVLIGFSLLVEKYVWLVSLLAILQFVAIFTTIGITDITIRDLGLLSAIIALFSETIPKKSSITKTDAA